MDAAEEARALGSPDRFEAGVFVGREKELTALRAFVDDALTGRGRLALIAGEPGIGKTRTAQELATDAEQRGMGVLWGRCYEGDGAPAYWPWVQILRAYAYGCDAETLVAEMGRGAVDIAQIVPEIRDRLPSVPSPPMMDPAQARFRLFDSITSFLKKVASRRPLVLVLDDLHWADTPSLLLLQFLAHAMESARLLVLGTYRDVDVEPQQPLFQALGDLARQQVTRRLVLSGLTEHDLAMYIEMTAGVAAAPSLVAEIAHGTEGNPFFVGEVIRLLIAEDGTERLRSDTRWTRTIPQGVREVIGRRLARLSGPCHEMLRTGAVIGREFGVNVLESIGEVPRGRLLELLDEAARARIIAEVGGALGRYRFAHALVRETLYDALTMPERVRLHRQVGEALEHAYPGHREPYLAELAHHFVHAAVAGDVQKAVDYARRAGERAKDQVAHEVAIAHYEQALQVLALEVTADARQRCDLLVVLAQAQYHAGDVVRSRTTVSDAAAVARQCGDAERLARSALMLWSAGGAWTQPGRLDEEAAALLEEALAALGPADGDLRARALGTLARIFSWSGRPDLTAKAVLLAREAVEVARRLGHREALADALFSQWLTLRGPDHLAERQQITSEWLPVATEAGVLGRVVDAYLHRIEDNLQLGDRAAFEQDLATCSRLAEEYRFAWPKVMCLSYQAVRAQMAGRFNEQEQLAERVRVEGRPAGGSLASNLYWGHLFVLRREQGRLAELEAQLLARAARSPKGQSPRVWLAVCYADTGRVQEARREFEVLAAAGFSDFHRDGQFVGNVAWSAIVCAYLGDRARASVLSALLLPYLRQCVPMRHCSLGSVAYYLGLLSTTLADWENAARYFEHALHMNAQLGLQPSLAHTQHDYARMLLLRGDRRDRQRALDLLNRSLDTAQELGMNMLAERALSLKRNAEPSVDEGRPEVVTQTRPASATALLHNDGDYWTLGYEDASARLKDSKGLQYLAHLLRHPGQEFHVLDLTGRVWGVGDRILVKQKPETKNQRLSTASEGLPILDEAAKAAYRSRLIELREELAEAERFNDAGRAERVGVELEAVAGQLAAAVGLGGRDRTALSATGRARSTVTQRIKAAIKRIGEHSPALADHLANRVKTGTFCVYRPDPHRPIQWRLGPS